MGILGTEVDGRKFAVEPDVGERCFEFMRFEPGYCGRSRNATKSAICSTVMTFKDEVGIGGDFDDASDPHLAGKTSCFNKLPGMAVKCGSR